MSKIAVLPVAIVGLGPYGLSLSAHLSAARIPHRIFPSAPVGRESGRSAASYSDPDDAFTLAAFCAERGLPFEGTGDVGGEIAASYARAFQKRFVPQLGDAAVARIVRAANGFALTLDDGESVRAARIVIAASDRLDRERFDVLDPELRAEIRTRKGAPLRSRTFQTGAPGLYLIGSMDSSRVDPRPRRLARRLTRHFETQDCDQVVGMPRGEALRVAFLTLTNDVGSDRIVSQMGREGALCAVVGLPKSFAFASRFVSERRQLPMFAGRALARIFARRELERLARDWAPDVLVALDDRAARVLGHMAADRRTSPGLRALIRTSLGNPEGHALACRVDRLLPLAETLGLRVSRGDIGSFGPEVVTHDIACRDGRVLEGLSLHVRQRSSAGSTIVSAIEIADMRDTALALVARLGLSGFASFEFLLDDQGHAHLAGMKLHPTSSTHLGGHFGHDLCRAFAADLVGVPIAPAVAPIWREPVALFPNELARAPETSPIWTDTSLRHDLPADDIDVVSRYLDYLRELHPASNVSILRLLAREAIFEPVRDADLPGSCAA